jgi:WD40 repeat protein
LAISFSEHSTKVWELEKGEFTEYDSVEAIECAYGNVAGIIDGDSEYVIDIKVTVIPLLDSCICFAKVYSTNPEMDRDKEIIHRGSQFISLFSGDGSMGFIPSHENGISGYLKTNSGDVITWGEDNRLVMISQDWGDIWSRQLDEAEEAGNLDELIENDNDEAALIKLKDLQIPNIVPLSKNRIVIYEYDTRGMILWNPIKREIESIIDTDEFETPDEIHVQDENIIFVEYETKIKKWNVTTKEVVSFEGHEEGVCDFFVINKDRIATKDELDIYRIWNSSTGECLLSVKNISEILEQSLNENGEFLCSRKKELVLIDGKDAKIIRRFSGYSEDAVITCAAIPDQRWLISSDEDKKIRLWGRDNRKCLAVFDNHKDHDLEYTSSEEFVELGKEHYLSFSGIDIKLLNIDDKTSISLGFDGDIDIDGYCIYPDLRILIWGYDFYSGEMLFRLCNGTTGQVYKEIEHKISGTGFELKYYLDKLVAQYSDVIEVMDPDTQELQSVSEKELEKYSKPFLIDKDQFCFIQENRVIFRNPGSSEMLQWHSDKIKSDVGDLKAWDNGSVSFDSQFLQLYYGSKPVLSRIKRD